MEMLEMHSYSMGSSCGSSVRPITLRSFDYADIDASYMICTICVRFYARIGRVPFATPPPFRHFTPTGVF